MTALCRLTRTGVLQTLGLRHDSGLQQLIHTFSKDAWYPENEGQSPGVLTWTRTLYSSSRYSSSGRSEKSETTSKQWKLLHRQGYNINPCRSPLHPSVTVAGIKPEEGHETCVQEAYTPDSQCFGCGQSAPDGLKLRSFRKADGLEAIVKIERKYCAFPGIINGGIISALFDCHGNWTAAVELMDRGCLPKPPLTLTYEMLVTYEEPTPPDEELVLRSSVVDVTEGEELGSKATVQVDLTLHQKLPNGQETLLVRGSGIFKKLGALRAL